MSITEDLAPITTPYLLVTCIPCHVDKNGARFLDALWVRDLRAHFEYLANFTLASPRVDGPPPTNSLCVSEDPDFAGCRFVDLPAPQSFQAAILAAPATVAALWRAVGQADIVHSGVNGWPFPPAWFSSPIAALRRRCSVIIVESAFWRLQPGAPAGWIKRLRAIVSERINRWCVNAADLAIFTHPQYQSSLRTVRHERGHVIHASWIDTSVLLSAGQAQNVWSTKMAPEPAPLRVLYVGRLTTAKGVDVLLESMAQLRRNGAQIALDLLGRGELEGLCQQVAVANHACPDIRLLGSVEYGPTLFELIRTYHLLVVPSVTDEQPRIVYDAYSQAVPVVGSDTAGLRDCIEPGVTGALVESGNANELAKVLLEFSTTGGRSLLPSLGMAGLERAKLLTHQEMHKQRWYLLRQICARAPLRENSC